MKRIAAFAAFVALCGHTKPSTYTPYGYEIVQLSPAMFPDVAGVRDVHQTNMIVRVDPNCPLPNVVRVRSRLGTPADLPVTAYGPLGSNLWMISTAHATVVALDGQVRIVADSTAADATYKGALGVYQ